MVILGGGHFHKGEVPLYRGISTVFLMGEVPLYISL